MKFFTLFAAGAMAASVVKRDVNQVVSDIKSIDAATKDLDTAIKAITGPDSKQSVIDASNKVLSAIQTATKDASSLDEVKLEQAILFSSPVMALADTVDTAVSDLISKKSTITDAGLGGTTEQQLLDQQKAAKTFADTITDKVEQSGKGVAEQLSAPILASLQKGVDAFQGLKDSEGGSSSSSAAASSSAPASSSSAAAGSSSSSAAATSAASSAASTPASYGTSAAATSSGAAYSTGAPVAGGNSTSPSSSPVPYTGAAGMNVAGFGGVLAAAALVAAF